MRLRDVTFVMLVREGGEMTGDEWWTCTDPMQMINALRGRVSERKLRLFACACYRGSGRAFSRRAVKVIELVDRWADGTATEDEVSSLTYPPPDHAAPPNQDCDELPWEVFALAEYEAHSAALLGIEVVRADPALEGGCEMTWNNCPDYLRWVFGCPRQLGPSQKWHWLAAVGMSVVGLFAGDPARPFRPEPPPPWPTPAADPSWLTSTVIALAEGIYADRAFDRLPILADALQDAGCENADILDHCRGPGPHVRGCWVVDLVLGKS